jgi:hypothetical protein
MSKATVVVETTVLIGSLFLVLRLAPAHIEYRPHHTQPAAQTTPALQAQTYSLLITHYVLRSNRRPQQHRHSHPSYKPSQKNEFFLRRYQLFLKLHPNLKLKYQVFTAPAAAAS